MGCANQGSVDILRVTEVGPRQLEIGDRLEISGQHFPQGSELKRVRVTLRATLARGGLGPCAAPVEVTITDPPEGASEYDSITHQFRDATYARSTQRVLRLDGPDRLAMVLSESLFEQLTRCPSERDRSPVGHATLSFGSAHARYARLGVTVRFEGITGTQAIEGTLRGATLDLLAPPSSRVLHVDALRRRSARVLDSLGITLADAHPPSGGLRIASVRNGGSAQRAGLGANDVLSGIDGLTVLSLEDLAVPEHTRATRISVGRDDILDERVVALDGYAKASPTDLLAASVSLLVATLVLALALRSRPGVLPSLARIAQQALARGDRGAFAPWLRARITDVLERRAGSDAIPWLALAAPISTLGLAPFLPALLRLGWDVGLLYALGAGLRLLAGPSFSFRTMMGAIPTSVASLLALGTSVVASGTFRAEGIVGAQGAAPWTWHAFRSPAATVLAVLFLIGLCVGAPDARPHRTHAEPTRRDKLRDGAGWVGTFFVATAGVTSLFGGWQVPGSDLGQQEASAALQMAGAALFLSKAWAITLSAAWLRWTVSSARTAAIVHRAGRSIFALALLSAALHGACALATPRLPAFVGVALAHGTFAFVVVSLVAAVLRPYVMRARSLQNYTPPVFSRADESVVH
jgi:hypothetical protein